MEYTWNIYMYIWNICIYSTYICIYGIIYMEYILYMEYIWNIHMYTYSIYIWVYISLSYREIEKALSDLMLILVDSNEVVKQTKHQSGTKQ